MKNIEAILTESGIELTDEQKTAITKAVGENYKPLADWQKQVDKVKTLETTVSETQETLKKFDGVNLEELNGQITTLKADLEKKDTEYQTQIADRDFQDLIKNSIAEVKGKNAKAIAALLDTDTLKASKNQKEDIAAALKALTEAEDSKMLFGEAEPNPVGNGSPIGSVGTGSTGDADMAKMRAVMGLPPEQSKGDNK